MKSGVRFLSISMGGVMLMNPLPGLTQTRDPEPQPDNQASESPTGEILVTAQRRSERARDVPLTVVQITGTQLVDRGITNTAQLAQITPGLRIERSGSYTQPAIRGISSSITSAAGDSPIATYIDGIYQQSTASLTLELPDVKNIEVLKGPQGTLFGRNATGGAIQIFTLDPTDTFNGNVLASYGSFNDVLLKAYISTPLVDGVAASIAAAVHNNDGYLNDLVSNKKIGGLKSHLIRGKLLIEPSDRAKIKLTGFYSARNDGSTGGAPLNGNTVDRDLSGAIIPTRPNDYSSNVAATTNVKNFGGSLSLEYDTGVGTLSALTGYTKWKILGVSDSDRAFVPLPANGIGGAFAVAVQTERGLSQEINFASEKIGILSFVAGLYYYDGYGYHLPTRIRQNYPTLVNIDSYSKQLIDAKAIFGELNADLTDRLTIIAGLRYSDEKRRLLGRAVPAGTAPGILPLLGKRHDTGTTPRASIRYKLTDQSNLYFTFSKGFKSGIFSGLTISTPIQSVSPESVTAYEIGSKSRFGPLDLSVSAFYYKYGNLQITAATNNTNGQVLQVLQNAANANIYGVDIDSALTLTKDLRVTFAVSILSAKYTNYPRATIGIPRPGNNGNQIVNRDVSGNHLNRAPAVSLNLTGLYTRTLAGGKLDLSSSIYYSSKYYFEAGNRIAQPAYATMQARVAWTPPDSTVTFAIFGDNLTNKLRFGGVFSSALADGVTYTPPRTIGASIGYKF